MYHTKKIGVFISHISGQFQCLLCQGIINKASEFGYFVEIFSSTDGENIGNYGIGEKSILRIPNFDDFSGIIFASGTYLSKELREQIAEVLQTKCSCPIIDINQLHSFAPAAILNNNAIIGQITEHLIGTHHYKRICYLGNNIETIFSDVRKEVYRKVMDSHNLPVSEYDVYECSYEEADITNALEHFLTLGRPDAIVCYNDRMALTLMTELLNRGFQIPEDIAITGMDTLEEGQAINPPLTSVTFPIEELGTTAVTQLLRAIRGEQIEEITVVNAVPHIGGSCGCPSTYTKNPFFYQHSVNMQVVLTENTIMENIRMSSSLQGCVDIDEGMNLLEQFIPQIPDCDEFYLCLYPDWDHISSHIRTITASEEDFLPNKDSMLLKFAYRNGKRQHSCNFAKQSTLPDYLFDTDSSAYFFFPLYFGEKEFGYIAIGYHGERLLFQLDFFSWLTNVGSMLRNITENKRTGLLLNRLEEIYMKDEMTGLYNRHGYNLLTDSLLERIKDTDTVITAFVFDLNGLKTINDTYGHSEGDFAIRILAHALESAIKEGDICARLGGDEFYLISENITTTDAQALCYQVCHYLESYNKLHTKEYDISVSIGYAMAKMNGGFDLQELVEEADRKMYVEKRNYHQ